MMTRTSRSPASTRKLPARSRHASRFSALRLAGRSIVTTATAGAGRLTVISDTMRSRSFSFGRAVSYRQSRPKRSDLVGRARTALSVERSALGTFPLVGMLGDALEALRQLAQFPLDLGVTGQARQLRQPRGDLPVVLGSRLPFLVRHSTSTPGWENPLRRTSAPPRRSGRGRSNRGGVISARHASPCRVRRGPPKH